MNAEETIKHWQELTERNEDLHPDLKPYLVNTRMGAMLKHPLFFQMFYAPTMNGMYNEQYRAKKKYTEDAKAKGDWQKYLWMYERPHRLQVFTEEIMDEVSDEEYWDMLGSIWSDSENLWQYGNWTLRTLLNAPREHRDRMMDDEERAFFATLPDTFTIYRGHHHRNREGFSWSMSYWKAKWFAHRWDQRRKGVVRATVNKADVVAVLLGRNEFEVVVDPAVLDDIKTVRKVRRPAWVQSVLDESWAGYKLSKTGSYHGLWHWEKVELNALALAKATPGCDAKVARLFTVIHDAKRENENEDPLHGHRAADFAGELHRAGKLDLTDKQLGVLQEACKYHNDGLVSDDPTTGVCWDADRLDLTRVGIIPDPKLLSTKAGRELTWRI
jgi:hypothetical protein